MLRRPDGAFVLELNERLGAITVNTDNGKNFINEEQFKGALRDFDQKDSLINLGIISGRIYVGIDHPQWERLGKGLIRHKIIGLFVHQSAIEYIANLFIISDFNKTASDSIKSKDNVLGLFNVYNNSLVIGSIESRSILSIMVAMWQEQFRSQSNDLQAFGRAIYLFEENSDIKIVNEKTLGEIFIEKTGLTIEQYLNVGLILFAFALTHPSITIADLASEAPNFNKVVNNDLMQKYLAIHAGTIDELKALDQAQNKDLNPKNTKNRFNPLWVKPMIKTSGNTYIVPSITTYIQALFTGLYWQFDELFMNEKLGPNIPKTTFRDAFGKQMFEPYVGKVLKDIYGEEAVRPEITYSKPEKAFTDWVVVDGNDAYLVEVKAYQFPFKTLQTGDLELIAKEITKKLIQDTVTKINKKVLDIETAPELAFLKGKNIIPVVVTYNVPLIDTSMYRKNIPTVVDEDSRKAFEAFQGYFMNIADLEYFGCVSGLAKLKDMLKAVQDKDANFLSEVMKMYKENKLTNKPMSERKYEEKMDYIQEMIKPVE